MNVAWLAYRKTIQPELKVSYSRKIYRELNLAVGVETAKLILFRAQRKMTYYM